MAETCSPIIEQRLGEEPLIDPATQELLGAAGVSGTGVEADYLPVDPATPVETIAASAATNGS